MKSVLITGSAGFVGTNLAEYYLKNGYFVFGLDNYITGSKENTSYLASSYPKTFLFCEHDVSSSWQPVTSMLLDFCRDKIAPIEYVFHLASPASVKSYQKFRLETMWANSLGLQNAISFADTQKAKVIFSSTSEIYGSPLSSPQRESDWGNVNSFGERSCYDESKRFGETLVYSSNKVNGTQHGVVRIFNTYGPRMSKDDDRVSNTFLQSALASKDIKVFGNGLQTRSFCFIDDLVNGLAKYAASKLNFPLNLGNDHEVSIIDFANLVIKQTQSKSKIVFKEMPEDDPPQRKPDLQLAKMHLNYSPEISLAEGLKRTISSLHP